MPKRKAGSTDSIVQSNQDSRRLPQMLKSLRLMKHLEPRFCP